MYRDGKWYRNLYISYINIYMVADPLMPLCPVPSAVNALNAHNAPTGHKGIRATGYLFNCLSLVKH